MGTPDGIIGLPVLTCEGCGVCCEEQGMPPGYLVPEKLTFLPEELREALQAARLEEAEAGQNRFERMLPCLWYDPETKRCRHYEYRPPVCREVEIGGKDCSFWRKRRLSSRSGAQK